MPNTSKLKPAQPPPMSIRLWPELQQQFEDAKRTFEAGDNAAINIILAHGFRWSVEQIQEMRQRREREVKR